MAQHRPDGLFQLPQARLEMLNVHIHSFEHCSAVQVLGEINGIIEKVQECIITFPMEK